MKLETLKLLIAAGNPIISISTPDEPRAAQAVHEVAKAIGLPVSVWSLTEGLQAGGIDQVLVEAGKPAAALRYVKDSAQPAIYLFKSEVLYEDYVLDRADLPRLVEAKRTRLAATGCLESIVADVSPDEIGGLRNLKRWLNLRHCGFSSRGQEFGLEPPRGILLLGVQGCGKSLCAKVVASAWRMPLVRMDPGVLYQKFVGETEARLREALQQAEAMAPVVFWIDEIEKAFASASSESADGGLSQRMFGTYLTWMQDHRQPIFIIATANDIERLPPELMRKGRFDEIFFVDLPGAEEREAIFTIHLRKRGRDKAAFDMPRLTAATENFTGAEIEQAVLSGLYAAYAEKGECTTEHILAATRVTQPIAVVMRERVDNLRAWAHGRCVMAD